MKAHVLSLVLIAPIALGSMGCSKLKAALGGGDGGTESSGSSAGPLAFLSGFEGEIDVMAKGTKPGSTTPTNVALQVKGNNVRADLPDSLAQQAGGKGYMILKGDEKKVYIVNDAQKQVILIDLNKAPEHLKAATQGLPHGGGGAAPTKPPPKITKTGKTDTVAGHTCENWEVLDVETNEKMVVCVAEQGVSWFHVPLVGAPAQYAWAAELLDGKHFPLRGVAFNKAGAEEGRVEVTKMDKKPIADTQFVYPPAYQVVDLGQMLGAAAAGGFGGAAGVGGLGAHPGLGGPHGQGHFPH